MPTELYRKKMVSLYQEMREPDLFLSTFFQAPPQNISDTEKISFDVKRSGESIAIPIQGVGTGPRLNSADVFTNKEFIPPSFNEAIPFNAYDLLKRNPGQNEYDAANTSWAASMISRISNGFLEIEGMIQRSIELQASQILQTGTLDLRDSTGATLFSIDFTPKLSHFPVAATPWDQAGANPLENIRAVSKEIRKDALRGSNRLIFGEDAFEAFLDNDKVQERLDNRRLNIGGIDPTDSAQAEEYQGDIKIGHYRYQMWTYDGHYEDPQTGISTPYVGPGKVIVLGRNIRLDKFFGGVPRSTPVDPRFAGFLPDRVAIPQAIDFAPNIYSTTNGKQLMIELESRPLLVPTAIDGFGCIDTGV